MRTFCGIITDGMLDYLATIYKLSNNIHLSGSFIKLTTTALAEKMHVSAAAASSMLKRLEESGFVDRSGADGITLTEQGRLAALQLIRRHRLLEVFLLDIMRFTWDQVDVEAHRLEHAISIEFEDRMDKLCGFPTHCPHGDPIPTKNGQMPVEQLKSLVELTPGQHGVLHRIGVTDARVLRYLSNLKLTPGRRVKLVDIAPFNGPVTLELTLSPSEAPTENNTRTSQILGNELAEQLFVIL